MSEGHLAATEQIELTDFQRTVATMVLDAPPPGKHAARSAIRHIEQAWMIRHIDPAMAAFRSITGEEEAATALFHALRRRHYSGVSALNPRSHRQKAAVVPFLNALRMAFSQFNDLKLEPTLEIDKTVQPLRIKLRITIPWKGGEQRWVYPEPPLGFNTQFNQSCDGFRDAINELATTHGAASILNVIRDRANDRNEILYATPRGIPTPVGEIEPPLLRRRDQVFQTLTIFLLVDQCPERQSFVEQAMSAFLGMMRLAPREDEQSEPS
jgi:hypothetical protein